MPMAEEFVNDDSDDRLNDEADAQISKVLFEQGQDYAARNKRSKIENKGRAESRAKIKELGMDANAYATAIRLIKDKTQAELKAWKRDFELTLKVMGSRQKELFPDEQLKAEARIQRAKDKAAKAGRTPAEMDADSDANPRSDPTAGGAQIDIEDAIAAAETNAHEPFIGQGTYHSEPKGQGETLEQREAAEGEAALAEAAPSIAKPKPKSQTAKAQAKRDAAQLPN